MLTAQNLPSEYKVKSIFLYNFTRFIDWPAEAFANEAEPFKIGILGNDPFGNYLEDAILGENMAGHPIVIERFKNINEFIDCHILYINLKDTEKVKEAIRLTENKSTLTVGEYENFTRWGGMIRIYSDSKKIKMQINDTAARNAQLKISAKLLNVADVYYP